MRFVVIEDFGMPSLVTDEEGNVKIFYTIEEATEEAAAPSQEELLAEIRDLLANK